MEQSFLMSENFLHLDAHLVALSLAHGDGLVLERTVVDGDGGHAEPSVRVRFPPNAGCVQLGITVSGELAGDLTRQLVHPCVAEEREDGALDGRDEGRELEHRLLLVVGRRKSCARTCST